MVEMYGPERMLVNSAGDWGPSKPTAVPDFIFAMRKRGHTEAAIRRIVYENPVKFFSGSRNFQVPGKETTAETAADDFRPRGRHPRQRRPRIPRPPC